MSIRRWFRRWFGQPPGRDWIPVRSSNIEAVAYEAPWLYCRFNSGPVYAYWQVSQEEFNELVTAESVGKFFHKVIKKHPTVRIEERL